MRKLAAYFMKELQENLSYRFDFVLRLASSLFFVLMFFYISRLLGPGASGRLGPYRGDYFSYVLIGLVFHGLLVTALHAFAQTLRAEQMTGTLEHLLVTPTPAWVFLAGGMLWRFVYDGAHLLAVLALGVGFLGAHYHWGGMPAAAAVLGLTLLSYAALGLFAGGCILVFKRGDPVASLFGFLTALVGGVYFPVAMLPEVLRGVSAVLPITYSLRLVRDVLLRGLPLGALGHDLGALAGLTVVLLPAGLLFFAWAVRRARADGSIAHY